MSRSYNRSTSREKCQQNEKRQSPAAVTPVAPLEVVVSGTINTASDKANDDSKKHRSFFDVLTIIIAVLALLVSIFSLNTSYRLLRVEAAPKIGLHVAYYQDVELSSAIEESDDDLHAYRGQQKMKKEINIITVLNER